MAKAIAFFEPDVRDAVPPERKDCTWATSNVNQPDLSRDLTELYNHCWRSNDYIQLYNWIDSITSEEGLLEIISPAKMVSWNFRNVLKPCGTVEFRRPPQVIDAKSTCHWIAFGLSFLSHAITCNFSNLTSASGYFSLQECIRRSACQLSVNHALADWHAMAQTIQISNLTAQDVAQITEQKRQKRSHFVQKVCETSIQNILNRLNSTGIECSP